MRQLLAVLLATSLTTTAQSQGSGASGAGSSSFPGWNVQYAMPAGWQVGQRYGRLHVLASTTQAGALFVATGLYSSFEEMVADLGRFYQSMNL